ncbi:enoyl-CoA hydratase [Thermocatellispora tengchongensis]|uniref:Enoyl-CoA hydratase n=1 Tax=Thermocatellispora tengchongensis TaxID=1073253 RepID=A0A840PLC6_9ACTN|nr:enoyl-CoA hydratase-related protein [Thermocatellispora tengchongensis]MBB5138420.1 enoyl-CoA hydratase [Thermocatellispora tengchongensis]
MTDTVLTEVVDENILVITLNRPNVKNAINSDISLGLRAVFEELDGNDELRVGVLTGAGGTFCSGMDLKEFARTGRPQGAQVLLREGTRKPLVAAVEGVALGGGLELALVADILVAASDALLGLPETRVGLFPSGGALYRLPGILPRPLIAELAFTGEPIGAERAHHFGLVSRVTPPGATLGEALTMAARIARSAPLGVAASKNLLRGCHGATANDFWARQRELAHAVFWSKDAAEGAAAFAERREPCWRNR